MNEYGNGNTVSLNWSMSVSLELPHGNYSQDGALIVRRIQPLVACQPFVSPRVAGSLRDAPWCIYTVTRQLSSGSQSREYIMSQSGSPQYKMKFPQHDMWQMLVCSPFAINSRNCIDHSGKSKERLVIWEYIVKELCELTLNKDMYLFQGWCL